MTVAGFLISFPGVGELGKCCKRRTSERVIPSCSQYINSTDSLFSAFFDPHFFEVLLGRGAPVIQNVGNARYRSLVKSRKAEYARAQRHSEKDAIARQILKEVTERKGKFLRRVATLAERKKLGAPDEISAVWEVVDFPNALEKTKQTLREKNYNQASEPESGEAEETPPTAASESVARMPQPNLGDITSLPASGIGGGLVLGAGAAPLSSIPGSFMPLTANDRLALLMMQRNRLQQYPGSSLFLNDQQLALQQLMQQQQSSPFAQAPTQQLPVDNQIALQMMMQRHSAARANRAQQQQQMALSLQGQQQQPLSSSPQSQLSLEQEVARTEAANAATASLLGLPSLHQYQQQQQQLQQQQLAAAALGRFPPTGLLGAAAPSPFPHLHPTATAGDGIDSSYLAFLQQQQQEGIPVARSISTVSAPAATTAASEGQQQQQVEEQKGNGGSEDRPTKKRTSGDDGSSSSGTGSRGSSSIGIGSEEDAKPAAQKTSKPR